MSSNLFVLKVQDQATAQQMLATLKRLQDQHLIKVDDAATVTRDAKGKPKIQQANDLVGPGALGGAFWGLLIGLLFFVPVFGAAIGAATGAIAAKFTDIGISDDFIKQVSNTIQPGQAALFLLTHGAVMDKITPELKQYKFDLIQSSLSSADEARLREMIGTTRTSA
jgi:uncharacterized membrane protein